MQHLINMSLYEIRHDAYRQEMAEINANGWKSGRTQTCREALAKALVALAVRLAPTITIPNTRTRAFAE